MNLSGVSGLPTPGGMDATRDLTSSESDYAPPARYEDVKSDRRNVITGRPRVPRPANFAGKVAISNPIIAATHDVHNPLSRIPTVDLATAVENDKRQRAADLRRVAEMPRVADLQRPSRAPASSSLPQVPAEAWQPRIGKPLALILEWRKTIWQELTQRNRTRAQCCLSKETPCLAPLNFLLAQMPLGGGPRASPSPAQPRSHSRWYSQENPFAYPSLARLKELRPLDPRNRGQRPQRHFSDDQPMDFLLTPELLVCETLSSTREVRPNKL